MKKYLQPLSPGSFTANEPSSSISNSFTRRRFLRQTGGATVASVVAWNSLVHIAKAQENNDEECVSGLEHQWVITDKRILVIVGKNHCVPIWSCARRGCNKKMTLPDNTVDVLKPCTCHPGSPNYSTCQHKSVWRA